MSRMLFDPLVHLCPTPLCCTYILALSQKKEGQYTETHDPTHVPHIDGTGVISGLRVKQAIFHCCTRSVIASFTLSSRQRFDHHRAQPFPVVRQIHLVFDAT